MEHRAWLRVEYTEHVMNGIAHTHTTATQLMRQMDYSTQTRSAKYEHHFADYVIRETVTK